VRDGWPVALAVGRGVLLAVNARVGVRDGVGCLVLVDSAVGVRVRAGLVGVARWVGKAVSVGGSPDTSDMSSGVGDMTIAPATTVALGVAGAAPVAGSSGVKVTSGMEERITFGREAAIRLANPNP
jgi:hypothetical protein